METTKAFIDIEEELEVEDGSEKDSSITNRSLTKASRVEVITNSKHVRTLWIPESKSEREKDKTSSVIEAVVETKEIESEEIPLFARRRTSYPSFDIEEELEVEDGSEKDRKEVIVPVIEAKAIDSEVRLPAPRRTSYHLNGSRLLEAPKNEAWEKANEMYLMKNKISKLPENPNCPELSFLSLQDNHHLRVIPPFFFQHMPILQTLDLSQTRIKSLPQSFFELDQLRKFILRGCELFKELPAEVGELCHLEVLDLEGTQIINLPVVVRKLTELTCLKVSFYCQINHNRKNHQSNRIIPQNVISSLLKLKELSIDVNPEDERWNATVKYIVKEVCSLNRLHSLKLYLPEIVLLNDLRNIRSSLTNIHFRFIVGSHLKCIISRLRHESVVKFEEEERCLKYMNGEGVPTEIKKLLQHVTALFLDRHLTVTSLSEFGIENMRNLKFCALGKCNEIQTIVDADDDRNVLRSLEYLNLHYLKNLRSISKGPLGQGSLSCLKVLALYSCPQLTTIFTLNLLIMLRNLEALVVEDCPEINSIVSHHDGQFQWKCFQLPNLKKIELHYLPKLVSISGGVRIGQSLEWLSFYDCPSLKTLYPEEFTSRDLKVVIGEADWWSALTWNESKWFQPPNLDGIFVPIERDTDLMTQLAEINNQLQARKQETEPSQQSGAGEQLFRLNSQLLYITWTVLTKLSLLWKCFLCE